MRVGIFVRNKWVIKDTEIIVLIVSTSTESIKKSGLMESCVNCLQLTTEVWFSSCNNYFFLDVRRSSDVSDEVDDFCFQCWLFVVPSSDFSQVKTSLNRSLFSFRHLHHILRCHISIIDLPSNFFLQKCLFKCLGFFFLGNSIIFPDNSEFV